MAFALDILGEGWGFEGVGWGGTKDILLFKNHNRKK